MTFVVDAGDVVALVLGVTWVLYGWRVARSRRAPAAGAASRPGDPQPGDSTQVAELRQWNRALERVVRRKDEGLAYYSRVGGNLDGGRHARTALDYTLARAIEEERRHG